MMYTDFVLWDLIDEAEMELTDVEEAAADVAAIREYLDTVGIRHEACLAVQRLEKLLEEKIN